MDKQATIKRLRQRLLILLAGLLFSYLISFGLAIFLIADAGVADVPWVWAIIAGFALLAIVHIRAQFRRYDDLVRVVEAGDDDVAGGRGTVL